MVKEYCVDKHDILKSPGVEQLDIKAKIDALGWHARCLPLLKNQQVVDGLALFK